MASSTSATVYDEADVGHPGPGRNEGQVGDPHFFGHGGGEVPAHQIGVAGGTVVGLGGADPLAASHPSMPSARVPPGRVVGTRGHLQACR